MTDDPVFDVSDVWFKLPTKLRQRYWRETGYGRELPSPELLEAIAAAAQVERIVPIERSTPQTHELKSWPDFFTPLKSGDKNFELRKNDRNFQVGDICIFLEFDDKTNEVTGQRVVKRITYILDGGGGGGGAIVPLVGLHHDYCILGLSDFET